jgi:hypothetical protein
MHTEPTVASLVAIIKAHHPGPEHKLLTALSRALGGLPEDLILACLLDIGLDDGGVMVAHQLLRELNG